MTVQVKLPNGELTETEITPRTTVEQLLSDVCEKQKLRATDFRLKYHGKTIDDACRLHYSDILKNATVEVAAASPESGDIRINVDINSALFVGFFNKTANLWEIITNLCPEEFLKSDNDDMVPVVTYLRTKLAGIGRLQSQTLESLGIDSGKATLRLSLQGVEKLVNHRPTQKEPIRSFSQRPSVQPTPSVKKEPQTETTTNPISGVSINVKKEEPFSSHVCQSEDEEFKPERHALVFSLSSQAVSSTSQEGDIEDEFFELTPNEVQKIYRDLIHERKSLEERPLLTNKLRAEDETERANKILEKYNVCVLRIYFPDKFVLQGFFHPSEKLSEVAAFVKSHLEDPNTSFYLYTAPPKQILNPEKSLIELNCVPRARIYFSTGSVEDKHFLRQSLICQASDYSQASNEANSRIQPKIIEKQEGPGTSNQTDDLKVLSQSQESAARIPRPSASSGSSKKEAVVPKWFKPGK